MDQKINRQNNAETNIPLVSTVLYKYREQLIEPRGKYITDANFKKLLGLHSVRRE